MYFSYFCPYAVEKDSGHGCGNIFVKVLYYYYYYLFIYFFLKN